MTPARTPRTKPVILIVQTAIRGIDKPKPIAWAVAGSRNEANRILRLLRRRHPDNTFERRDR